MKLLRLFRELNEISNGFSTGTIINLNNGIPTDDKEKRAIEKEIQENASGEENAGGTMILYSNGKENSAEVISLSGNDLKDRYLALSQDNRDNILLSHSVTTPILFGIKTEGSLGNATELEIGYKIMKANYFKYKQRAILQALNYIGKTAFGLQGEIVFNEVDLDLPELNTQPTTVFSDNECEECYDMENPCWDGYEPIGTKIVDGREVPNCVPKTKNSKEDFESYNDYPEGAVNNAKRALAWKEENGTSCGTSVGWRRASQLASKSKISRDTISRMASFKRHQQHKDVPYSEGCGGLMWDAWGGSSGVNWAISKLKEIDKEKNLDDTNVSELFNLYGRPRPKNCLISKSLPAEFDADEETEKIMDEFKKQSFATLSAIENQVLSMIQKGNDYNSIRKALGINPLRLGTIYYRFKSLGFIDLKSNITTNGLLEIAKQDVTKIEIFYSYDKNPDVDGDILIPTSRDFCRALVGFSDSKVWSREDIDKISSRIGYNAFAYRGGWYYNDKLERATPYCRHIWKQEIFFT